MEVHTLQNGTRIGRYPKPPADFDPLSASQSELRKHGFPARPANPKLLARYVEIFTRLKPKLRYIDPNIVSHPGRPASPMARGPTSGAPRLVLPGNIAGSDVARGSGSGGRGNLGDPAWSGALVYPEAGQWIKCAIGEFQVPDADFPNAHEPGVSFDTVSYLMWVGIGAPDSGALVQAGVGADITATTKNFYTFYEWAPGDPKRFQDFPVSVGDTVLVLIHNTGEGHTEADLFMVNETTGDTVIQPITSPPGPTGQGIPLASTSANWVMERNYYPGNMPPVPPFAVLAPYGTAKFWTCFANSGTEGDVGATLEAGSGLTISMEQVDPPLTSPLVLSRGALSGNQEVVECFFEASGTGNR